MGENALSVGDEVFRALVARKCEGESFDDVLERELGLVPTPSELCERTAADADRPVRAVVATVSETVGGRGFVVDRRGDPWIRYVPSEGTLVVAEIRFAPDELRVRCRADYHGAMETVARFGDGATLEAEAESDLRDAVAEACRRWG